MHAIVQREFGGPDTLHYEVVDDLTPGRGQVRVAVAVAGVHLIDTRLRAGLAFGPYPPPDLPMTPGREVGGTVDALGLEVDPSWLGRRVVSNLAPSSGGYAEQAVVDLATLMVVPDGVELADAVAAMGTGRMALLIAETAAIESTDVVLITAAAGGIGSLLVQLAHDRGATVVGLAGGPTKVAVVEGLGADLAVDYVDPGWITTVAGWLDARVPTVGLDGVAGDVGHAVLDLIGPGGRMVTYGMAAGGAPITATDSTTVSITSVVGPRANVAPERLEQLKHQAVADLATGRLHPLVHPPFGLADAADAHRALESRRTTGKVVLVPQPV